MSDHLKVVTQWEDFLTHLENKCLLQVPFCGVEACEDEIKDMSKKDESLEPGAPSMGAKSLCIPFTQPAQVNTGFWLVNENYTYFWFVNIEIK